MLNLAKAAADSTSGGGSSAAHVRRDSSIGASRSASVHGRRSGEIIEEEDEEIEEVDAFGPVLAEEGETVWEERPAEMEDRREG